MPKDAKFGLILGIGLVILIAVLFFRKDRDAVAPAPASAVSVQSSNLTRPPASVVPVNVPKNQSISTANLTVNTNQQ